MQFRIDGAVLAGGRSTRMGGRDKALIHFDGQPMVQRIASVLQPYVHTIWINTSSDNDAYRSFDYPLCSDIITGHSGPLAGIHSVLTHSQADYVLFSPCDTPQLQSDFPARILAPILDQDTPPLAVCAQTSERHHCLHACISTRLASSLARTLHEGHFKVYRWLLSVHPIWVDFSDVAEQFENVNYPHQIT